MIPGCILVLGATNDAEGVLSPMALRRLRLGRERFLIQKPKGWKILLTGGFGSHFNTTAHPHAEYARARLISSGILPSDILETALSGHTIDDAIKAAPIIERHHVPELEIITSDFHLQRAEVIFRTVFPHCRLSFFGSACLAEFPSDQQSRVLEHEARRVRELQEKSRQDLYQSCRPH